MLSVNSRRDINHGGILYVRRVELVLLHPSDEQPQGTAAWLAPRPQLARHHHLRLANTQARQCTPPEALLCSPADGAFCYLCSNLTFSLLWGMLQALVNYPGSAGAQQTGLA